MWVHIVLRIEVPLQFRLMGMYRWKVEIESNE